MNDNASVDRQVGYRRSSGDTEGATTAAFRSDLTAHREGLALLRRLHGAHSGEQLVASLREICPDFADMTIEWAIHGVMARPGLDLATRELLLIAACTTLGFATPQLRAHIEGAVAVGATRQQIVETILQMTFYAGGAATSNAMRIAAEVLGTEPAPAGDGYASTVPMKRASTASPDDASAEFQQVVDALYRFGAGQDLHDRELFASAFTESAVIDFRQPASRLGVELAPFSGRTQIVDRIMATVARLDTTHTVTNPRVTFHGGEADLFALVDAYHLRHDGPTGHLQLKNIYRARLVRGDSDWRIDRLHIHNVWMTGDAAVLFSTASNT